jgi:hypothetical protein
MRSSKRSSDATVFPYDKEFPPDELGISRVLVDGTRPLYYYEGNPYKTYAAALGARGGKVTSPAKAEASKANSKLGGRPKKSE